MATVSKWTPFGVALDLTATAGTVTRISATQYTVKINVSWETYYSGAETNYGMDASSGGATATINKFGTIASKGSGTLTGTYSISGNAGATKTITVTFKNYNTDNNKSATKSISLSVSVPAWTSYTVKYNANGGSGAPSSQTKWKDQTLTLSSTKPTRTGYTFQGWALTKANADAGTWYYQPGGSCGKNENLTLYAVWKANTYTVSYNANGGTGAPGSQTKTYGVALTLSSTKPTRTNYNFKGWGTSASATTVSYAAGASYTTNAAITLYAIWELAYIKPRITKLSVTRCNAEGVAQIDGTHAIVKFSWACDRTVSSIRIQGKLTTASEYGSGVYVTASGTSGSVSQVLSNYAIESSYNILVTVADSVDSSIRTITLSSTAFTIHAKPGGNGIAFGKMAELDNLMDVAFDANFNGNVYGRVFGLGTVPQLPQNADLNDYKTPGIYGIAANATAATITNIPIARAGRLIVSSAVGYEKTEDNYNYICQEFRPLGAGYGIYMRDISSNAEGVYTYSNWYHFTGTEIK